jgi:hypothetical protein
MRCRKVGTPAPEYQQGWKNVRSALTGLLAQEPAPDPLGDGTPVRTTLQIPMVSQNLGPLKSVDVRDQVVADVYLPGQVLQVRISASVNTVTGTVCSRTCRAL